MRRVWRRVLIAVAALLAVAVVLAGLVILTFRAGNTKVAADPQAGFHWSYFLNTRGMAGRLLGGGRPLTLLVLPNNTGHPDDSAEVHEREAERLAFSGHVAFWGLDAAILVPVFPRPREHDRIYTHALDRDCLTTGIPALRRVDRQLAAMIDDAVRRLRSDGWDVEPKVLMAGFSASGMFVNRFALLHPERVRAAVVGSPGGWPIAPLRAWKGEELPYPAGIADVEALTGTPFDPAAFSKVPLMMFIGDRDENDSVPYSDSYDDRERRIVRSLFGDTPVGRWGAAEAIYAEAGANAVFHTYRDLGHGISNGEVLDIRRFLATH
jgi:pimeloyl-ACP methyl ester carboxylesterase